MTRKEIAEKNLILHQEFMRYVFDHPEVLDRIPKNAQIVFLPDNEPKLCKENMKIAQAHKKETPIMVFIRMPLPEPTVPKIEVVSA